MKYKIIEGLAKERKVEEFIANTTKTDRFDLDDLANDIYMSLLSKDDDLIIGLHERGELDYWIAKMIWLNYYSSNSPYYTKYRKFSANTSELTYNDINKSERETWMRKKSNRGCEY